LLQYVVALARANRVFLGDVRETIRKGHFDRRGHGAPVSCLMIALWDRLAVLAGERDEKVLADFRLAHAHFEAISHGGSADEVWRAYREWMVEHECAHEFAMELFFRAKLVAVEERLFFEEFVRASGERKEAVIEKACKDIKPWARGRAEPVAPAKRLTLIVRACPERKEKIVQRIPENIRRSFPRGQDEWAEFVQIFNG
jgi:hypothetical protein